VCQLADWQRNSLQSRPFHSANSVRRLTVGDRCDSRHVFTRRPLGSWCGRFGPKQKFHTKECRLTASRTTGIAHVLENRAYRFAVPSIEQGAAVHALVDACKPLDLNSTYAYLLLCHHFASTCVVCMHNDDLVGFISAYIPPEASTTVFVWQVAVHPEHRGRALGGAMLAELLARPALRAVTVLETTVSPSNVASTTMFRKLARAMGAQISEHALFLPKHFGGENHEKEVLLRISPLK